MPRKMVRRPKRRVNRRSVDPGIFRTSDGVNPIMFLGDVGFDTRDEARAAYALMRRDVWPTCHRFRVPHAAATYDDLRTVGVESFFAERAHQGIRAPGHAWPPRMVASITTALDADLASVDAFEVNDPAGAAHISDYLVELRADIAAVRRELQTLARLRNDRAALEARLPLPFMMNQRYGSGIDAVRKAPRRLTS